MTQTHRRVTHLLVALAAFAGSIPRLHSETIWAELTSYTKQSGYALLRIDDSSQPGKIEFTVELPGQTGARATGIFLNFLGGRPQEVTEESVSGPAVESVELDTKDLGGGNNLNPSPSERPKGLFELGVAIAGSGVATFTIDNSNGLFDRFSFGPFAMRVEHSNGRVAKLFGVPVLETPAPSRATKRSGQAKSGR